MVKKKQELQELQETQAKPRPSFSASINVEEQEFIQQLSVMEDIDLNLRAEPNLKSKIIGCITSDDRITVAFYSPESDWTEVVLDSGVRGFVMTKFLRAESCH